MILSSHEHRGVQFQIVDDCGIRWRIDTPGAMGRELWREQSQGCFYDGCDDHPEGAKAWAEDACRLYIDKGFKP